MSPYEAIIRHYDEQGVDFAPAFSFHLRFGHVFATPSYFLMCLPVSRRWLESTRNPSIAYNMGTGAQDGSADCWYIGGMAGVMNEAWRSEPYPLPWFAFERGKELHIWPSQRIRQKTCLALTVISS